MVPNGWITKQVKDICSQVSVGIVIKPAQYYVDKDQGVRAFRSANVREGRVGNGEWVYLSHEGNLKNSKSQLKTGDVLVVRSGYPGTACVLPEEYNGSNCIDIIFARPQKNVVIPEYLCAFTNSEQGKKQVLNTQGGLAQKHLNVDAYGKMRIPLPPLPEQKKIARILSTWDKAIETVDKLIENSKQQKKALMQQLLTGKKRLPGFSGEWRFYGFSELFRAANDKSKQLKTSEYCDSGAYPIVDQGQSAIAAYTNNSNLYDRVPVIIFGDHTRIVKWVDFPFAPGADGTQVLKTKNNLSIKYGFFLLQNTEIPNLGYSRHMRELKEKEFFIPTDENEQNAISEILSCQDKIEQSYNDVRKSIASQKQALMQQLLTGKRRVKVDDDRSLAQAGQI